MTKLNQIIAVSKSKKAQAVAIKTRSYQILQKNDLFTGIERNYTPKEDDGERLPSESKKVQATVSEVVESVRDAWTNMFDVVLTQDVGNSIAKANVVVNGSTILKDMPATTLIFLEKELTDFKAFVEAIPTLGGDQNWSGDTNDELFKSEYSETHRTKKVSKPIVLYDATENHPAQTQLVTEDILAGYWKTRYISGAIPAAEKKHCLKNVEVLKEAVVRAREQANSTEIEDLSQGQAVFNFIFG